MNISRSKAALRLVPAPDPVEKNPDIPEASYRRGPGAGELFFEKMGAQTVLRRAYAKAPLKWMKTFHRAPAAWVYASSYGGGLVGGDHLNLRVRVGKGALGFVTTQASMKVFRSELKTGQSLEARVQSQGRLIWLPDPMVCFEGSDYGQTQDFHLEAGAGLIFHDALTSGRRSRDERWKFRRYLSRTRIFREGKIFFYDALRLDPREGPLEKRLGRFNLLATILICGGPFQPQVESILQEGSAAPGKQKARLLEYWSRLGPEGLVWRLAGVDPEEAADRVKKKLSFLSEILGDDPWKRKLSF